MVMKMGGRAPFMEKPFAQNTKQKPKHFNSLSYPKTKRRRRGLFRLSIRKNKFPPLAFVTSIPKKPIYA